MSARTDALFQGIFAPKHGRGFTLIELLVVISIIGLLASIILASLTTARQKGVSTQASEDFRSVQTALELYYEANGDWPPVGTTATYVSVPALGWNTLNTALAPYISSIPYPLFTTNYVVTNGHTEVTQGYGYMKATAQNPIDISVSNGVTQQFVDCVILRDGYMLDYVMPQQSSLTLYDGGVDPDGIDALVGDYTLSSNPADCP